MHQTHPKTIFPAGVALLLAITMIALASCAGPDRTDRTGELQADPSRSVEQTLRRLAGREQRAGNLKPIDAPIPPGIEPEALAARSRSDERAFHSLEDALRELVAVHHPEASEDGADVDTARPDPDHDETAESGGEGEDAGEEDTDDALSANATRHYVRGRQAMLEERLYVAITELLSAAQLAPDSPRIRRELARVYLAMNNHSRAMEQYAQLRRLVPDDDEAVFSLGLHAANRREFATAAAILGRRMLNDQPFEHDPAADMIVRFTMAFSLRHLGYDRAFIETWTLETTELPMTGDLFERTIYAGRLGSIYRQRAELWRSVGDAHCRLGQYRNALDAYAISASLPAPDPAALHPRVIYANMRLGRVHSAQYELFAALSAEDGSISERDIRLCTYLADTIVSSAARRERDPWPVRLLADHVRERYAASPDDAALARAAAALLPPEEARQVLREFVDRRPRDLGVVASLLAWLGSRDLESAIALTVDMVEANPDLGSQYVNRLIFAVPDALNVLEALDAQRLPEQLSAEGSAAVETVSAHDLAMAHVKALVLATLGATGEAWQLTERFRPAIDAATRDAAIAGRTGRALEQAHRRLRNARAVALLRLGMVTMLEEPSLLEPVMKEIAPESAVKAFDSVESWIVRARVWRRFNRIDEAMDAAERAVSIAERAEPMDAAATSQLVRALLEQASTYSAYAESLDVDSLRAQWAEEAVLTAERVVDLTKSAEADDEREFSATFLDSAYRIILTTFGPGGILRDGPQFRDAARRLYERNPDSRLYVRMTAEEAISQGRFDLALERAMNLYDTYPHESGAIDLAMMAWSRMSQPGGLQHARQWLAERLARRPGDPALLETWVQVMLQLDRANEVIHTLQGLVEARPRNVTAERLLETAYRATGRTDLAFPLGEKRLLSRPRGVRRDVELAALYGGMGMEREAISRLQWLIENIDDATHEHLLTAIAILGRLDPTDSRHDEMTVALVKHAVLERSAQVPMQVYGRALRSLGRRGGIDDPLFRELVVHAAEHAQGAGESFETVIQWRNLAQALIDDDLPAVAAEAVRGRVEADVPLGFDALGFLTTIAIVADAAVHGGAEQAEKSIALLERLDVRGRLPVIFGMDSPATLPDALFQASVIYSIVGDLRGSKRVLEALIEIEPNHTMALNNLGYLRLDAGQDDEQTKQWIERAIKLEPEDSHILDTFGWLRYMQGRFEDDKDGLGALSLIEASIERAERPNGEVHGHLGDVLWRLGRHDEAIEAWREAERILTDPERREEMVQTYHALQHRAWGILVDDPEVMYDRDYGKQLIGVQEKLKAVEAGEEPPIAPTFAELRRGLDE